MQETTKILFVCMGNICRSPAAECFFRLAVEDLHSNHTFIIDSAGTGGWHAGNAPDRRMRAAAEKRGLQISGSARQITSEDVGVFDIIFCMDEDNYNDVLSMGGTPEKTKMLLPFVGSSIREVPDPYYGGEDGFDDGITLILDATKKLANMLC
jgi:protein-tyrosine phosphatase